MSISATWAPAPATNSDTGPKRRAGPADHPARSLDEHRSKGIPAAAKDPPREEVCAVDASLAYLAFLAYLAKAAQAVGMTTITAGRKRRALDAAWELVQSRSCITMRELAHELASVDDFRVILIALSDSDLVVTTPDKLREDPADNMEATWGPDPSEAELTEARRAGDGAAQAALDTALTDALSRDAAAQRIGVSPQAVSDRVKAGKLVGLRRGREWRFPSWQFADDGTLPGLDELIATWPSTPLALSTWAVTPSPDLEGRTPAQALGRRGGPERVRELAHAVSASAW
jgi:hypothetical protein